MQDYYFDFSGVGSFKASSKEEAIKKIHSFNVIGLTLTTVTRDGNLKSNKVDLHDIEINHESAV